MREKIEFEPDYGTKENSSIIKVIGVGGGGGNAVQHMYSEGIVGVNFLICNTDRQALEKNRVSSKLVLGETGLGAGANPELARELAWSSEEKIKEFIGEETKMLFITAGMGKGTGTGAAPVVAEIAKEMGILTIGVVTFPFDFEGELRANLATQGINELRNHVDSLLIIKNQNIMKYYNDASIKTGFGYADDVLKNAVKCIAELITVHAEQNVDFNDISTIMKNSGEAMLGLAVAEGDNRINDVVEKALNCQLLNDGNLIRNAKNFLFFISYGSEKELLISELDALTQQFNDVKNADANIIWGRAEDESLGAAVKLSVIITNFNTKEEKITENRVNITDSQDLFKDNYPTTGTTTEKKIDPFEGVFGNQENTKTHHPSSPNSKDIFNSPQPNPHTNSPKDFFTSEEERNKPQNLYDIPTDQSQIRNPQCVNDGNKFMYNNPDMFDKMYKQPTIEREPQTQHYTQTQTLEFKQNQMEIEDDSSSFFLKNIPD